MSVMGFLANEANNSSTSEASQIPPQDFKHAICIGDTGSGKTATFIMPTLKDRIEQGNAIVFMDHKGHERRKIMKLALDADRLDDVVEIGKPFASYINMLSLFDSDSLNRAIITLLGGIGKDPYWTYSASRLAVRIVELQRGIYEIGKVLCGEYGVNEELFHIALEEEKENSVQAVLTIEEAPSFESLSKVLATPGRLTHFFNSIEEVAAKIEKQMEHIYTMCLSNKKKRKVFQIQMVKLLKLQELIEKYRHFSIDTEEEGDAGGNNGVLQVLNNALTILANQPSMNYAEVELMALIKKNAIVIIDTQSVNIDMYGILLETLLKRLGSRIMYEIPNAVSIFVDEANRVLPAHIDLSNDVMRESRAELILAAQNEEQMLLKFGEVKWRSIVKNLKHQYRIDSKHRLHYHENRLKDTVPLLFNNDTLDNAEYAYQYLEKNRQHITSRFMLPSSLPEKFTIQYSIQQFAVDASIGITDSKGVYQDLMYIGEKIQKTLLQKVKIFEDKIEFFESMNNINTPNDVDKEEERSKRGEQSVIYHV